VRRGCWGCSRAGWRLPSSKVRPGPRSGSAVSASPPACGGWRAPCPSRCPHRCPPLRSCEARPGMFGALWIARSRTDPTPRGPPRGRRRPLPSHQVCGGVHRSKKLRLLRRKTPPVGCQFGVVLVAAPKLIPSLLSPVVREEDVILLREVPQTGAHIHVGLVNLPPHLQSLYL